MESLYTWAEHRIKKKVWNEWENRRASIKWSDRMCVINLLCIVGSWLIFFFFIRKYSVVQSLNVST